METLFAPTIPTEPPQDNCTPSQRISVTVTADPNVAVNSRVVLLGIAEIQRLTRECELEETPLPFTWALSFQAPGGGVEDISNRLSDRTTLTPSFLASEVGTYWLGSQLAA
jgi:hypothetical protein